jgi:hypothetical protein
LPTSGANILLDGRSWKRDAGCWVGPTIIVHSSSQEPKPSKRSLWPRLSIYVCSGWEEAIAIENASPFGNAATTNGGCRLVHHDNSFRHACQYQYSVPRNPFRLKGLYGTASKYSDMDITGDGVGSFPPSRFRANVQCHRTCNSSSWADKWGGNRLTDHTPILPVPKQSIQDGNNGTYATLQHTSSLR